MEGNETKVLETAYIELKDCREGQTTAPPTNQAKNVLAEGAQKGNNSLSADNVFKVQFNPASLQFSAGAATESKEKKSLTKKDDGTVDTCSITDEYKPLKMSMQLVFDRSIYEDSSVQPEVEGFLSIIQNPYIRQVGFHWGELYYFGKITEIQVKYTMFNIQGIPMRAVLDIKMDIY